jgi:hypothetical protein
VQPHRSVASKNGDLRYQGPKYNVLDVTSGIALVAVLIAHLLAPEARTNHGADPPSATRTESSFNLNHCISETRIEFRESFARSGRSTSR